MGSTAPRVALVLLVTAMYISFLVSLPVLLGSDSFGQVGCRHSSTYDIQAVRLVSDMLRIAASLVSLPAMPHSWGGSVLVRYKFGALAFRASLLFIR